MAQQPGYDSFSLGDPVGKQQPIYLPNLFNMSGFRSPTFQQIPCKTINEITYPPAKISNINVMSGYNSMMFGHRDKVPKDFRMFASKEHPLDTKLLKPSPTFFF